MKVKWQFIDSNHLQELHSGFVIRLLKGTWFHPIQYDSLPTAEMNEFEQALMIKSAMAHIDSLSKGIRLENY